MREKVIFFNIIAINLPLLILPELLLKIIRWQDMTVGSGKKKSVEE